MANSRIIFVRSFFCLIAVLTALLTLAAANPQESAGAPAGTHPPVAYASVNELNGILTQLEQTAQSIQSDLAKTHIEKWKTDSATKRQTLADVESIQRNLQSALPDMIAQLKSSPEGLGDSFKLYRNLVVLYDYFRSVAETAGAFGSKDDYQSLSNDLNGLESARRTLGERMQKLTASKEDELTRLRVQVKKLSAAPPPPPQKIVVDDTVPPKKPAKKKVTKPKPAPATTDAPPNTSLPN